MAAAACRCLRDQSAPPIHCPAPVGTPRGCAPWGVCTPPSPVMRFPLPSALRERQKGQGASRHAQWHRSVGMLGADRPLTVGRRREQGQSSSLEDKLGEGLRPHSPEVNPGSLVSGALGESGFCCFENRARTGRVIDEAASANLAFKSPGVPSRKVFWFLSGSGAKMPSVCCVLIPVGSPSRTLGLCMAGSQLTYALVPSGLQPTHAWYC